MGKKDYIGSNFDNFLEEEGLLAEANAVAIKRVIAYQLMLKMKESHISKTALAKKMGTSRSALDRLLDPENYSVTLLSLEKAAIALGSRLHIQIG